MKAFVDLVFPNSIQSVIPKGSSEVGGESIEDGIITSVTHGVMSGAYHTLIFDFEVHIMHFYCSRFL